MTQNFLNGNLLVGAPLGMAYNVVYLTADDTAVPTAGVSMLWIGSNSATASARTFTLAASALVGHELTLLFNTASTSCQLAESSVQKLVGDWTPGQYDILRLVSDGTNWIELSRGNITNGPFNGQIEASGTLSQANLIAMYTTPVTLIADPGTGVALIVDEVELRHTYSTTAYTGGDDVSIEYSDGTDIFLVDKTIVTNTSSTSRILRPTIYNLDDSTGTGLGFAITAAKGVQITNATAVFAAGNAANTLSYRIRYHLLTLLA